MAAGRDLGGLDRADIERVADVLARLHAEGPGEDSTRTFLDAFSRPERAYAEARRHFGRQERVLREQSAVASRIIDGLRGQEPAPLQRLLRLRSARGETAGGRFLVQNEAAERGEVTFRPRFDLPCRFSPPSVTLDPGASVVVDIRLDLGEAFVPGELACLLVEVHFGGHVRTRLWVEVSLDPAPP